MTTVYEHLESLMPSRELHEHFSENEHLLRELIASHPPCSMQMLRSDVLQLLASMSERRVIEIQNLPVVGKSHDDAYLRPPLDGERECVRGSECLCNFLAKVRHGGGTSLAFVGVEFMTPAEKEQWEASGQHPKSHGRCLLCIRYLTTLLYTMARCDPRFRMHRPEANQESDTFGKTRDEPEEGQISRTRRRSKQQQGALLQVDTGEGTSSMHELFDAVPAFTNSVNCDDGYVANKVLFFDEEFVNSAMLRETSMSSFAFRPLVRFCSTDYKFTEDANGRPRIVQCGMGCKRHLNCLAPSNMARSEAPESKKPQN